MRKTGIFSGTFDPVHAGHIAFALAAVKEADLDAIYLAPEARPRRKDGVTHVAHRLAMLRLAVAAHSKLKVLELPDKQFTPAQTIPRLKQLFPKTRLMYVCGSDMLAHMPEWPLVKSLTDSMGLVVGLRGSEKPKDIQDLIAKLPSAPLETHIIFSPRPEISGGKIRQQLVHDARPNGLLSVTKGYIKRNWLYDSPGATQ
jgi:nicotinate-nucleotide adenylyltransferase